MTQPRPSLRPLHVALLASDLTRQHGWAHYSLQLTEALAERDDIRLTILTQTNSPPVSGLPALPILPVLNPMQRGLSLRLLALIPRVRKVLAEADMIHALAEPYAPLAAAVAGERPLVITGHGSYVNLDSWLGGRWQAAQRAWYRRAFRQAGQIITVSAFTAQQAKRATPGVQTTVVANAVEAERFAHLRRVPPEQREYPGFSLLTVGAVKPRKGTLELVRAVAALREHIPDARLLVIGSLTADRDYTAQVQNEITRLNAGGYIRLAGFVPESYLLPMMEQSDVFVLPSMNKDWRFEGFGLALLEGSAAGLAVVGTRDCGLEDAVIEGETGLLVSQRHIADELPAALLRLARDPALAARMGEAGRIHAAAHSWADVVEETAAVYRQVVGGR